MGKMKNDSWSDERSNFKSSSIISVQDIAQVTNVFHFWNGDKYEGQFSPIKEKQTIAMDGKGVYQTSDGHTYEGIWENDDLKDECKIVYPDQTEFSGSLLDMMMEGPGKFRFKENVEIEADFMENKIMGKVNLVDPNQHTWRGEAKKDDNFIHFVPLHPFWQSVLQLPSKFQIFYGEADEEIENVSID